MTQRENRVELAFVYPFDPLGSKVGGPETFIRDFAKYSPETFNIYLIGITTSNELKCGQWHNISVANRDMLFYPLLYEKDENRKQLIPLSLRFTGMLMRKLFLLKNKVLFFNRIEPSLICYFMQNPKLVVIHNDIAAQVYSKGSEVLWSKMSFMYGYIEKMCLKKADKIYSVSERTLQIYAKKYPVWLNKCIFLPTWVDLDIYFSKPKDKGAFRKQFNLENSKLNQDIPWILFVGRLQEQKAPLRLIDVSKELRNMGVDFQLLLVGDGNLRSLVERKVDDLGLCDVVIFLGAVTREVLERLYNASNVLILTSNFEGMPRCVLEGLGCGLPVVTTDVGEVKRVVKNGFSGEVVHSFESSIIVQALDKVLSNLAQYMPANCVKSIEDYTPKKVLAPVYEEIRQLYYAYYGKEEKHGTA